MYVASYTEGLSVSLPTLPLSNAKVSKNSFKIRDLLKSKQCCEVSSFSKRLLLYLLMWFLGNESQCS